MFEFLTSLSLWGTIVNALGIIAGTVIGVILKSFSHGKKEEGLEGGLGAVAPQPDAVSRTQAAGYTGPVYGMILEQIIGLFH